MPALTTDRTDDITTTTPTEAATVADTTAARTADAGRTIATAAGWFSRYALALVVGWIGILKFSHYEAAGIMPLAAHSPFLSWTYSIVSVDAFGVLLGIGEVAAAILIALRPLVPRVSAIGSVLSAVLFLGTISFLFTTPGVLQEGLGFPELSMVGQFLIKDVALFGLSVWTLGEALAAGRRSIR